MNKNYLKIVLVAYMVASLALPTALLVFEKVDGIQAVLLAAIGLTAVYLLRSMGEIEQAREDAEKVAEERMKAMDAAYNERNYLVALLARLYPSGIRPTTIEGWDPVWQNCVYIDTPAGQVSYHYHDKEARMFEGLPPYTREWDGHDKLMVHMRLLATPTLTGLIPTAWLDHQIATLLWEVDHGSTVGEVDKAHTRRFCENLNSQLTEYLGGRVFLQRDKEPEWHIDAEQLRNGLSETSRQALALV